MTLLEFLEHMQQAGQSVTLTRGEDNDLWECSWITSGVRFTAFSLHPEQAVRDAWHKALAAAAQAARAGERSR